jgi:tRNA A-37 threonylcarbamoyl transferase component Bud32
MSGDESSETDAGLEALDPDAAGALVGRVIAGRYRIDALLGVGGMGAVYRAEHVLMKKAVAVKVLHREMTAMDEVVKRFEREAIAAGRIDHPHVTVATDFGKLEDGAFYLVLEYVPGRSLTAALKEDGAFSEERALFIARQIAAGLGAAHAAGIVHRDLKPDNVMLIERGGTRDFVKVLDFGIAKVSAESTPESPGSQLTRIGAVFGTPAYMSPEQAAGQNVDPRADLYALGLVLYEMLAGHPAFESGEIVALLAKQLTEPPPPLPETISPEVRALVFKLVEKAPGSRVQTAGELVLAIDARLGPASSLDGSMLGASSSRSGSTLGQLAGVSAATIRVDTSAGLPARLRAAAAVIRDHRPLRVLGRDVPVWIAGAAGILFVALLATLPSAFHGTKTSPSASAAPKPAPPELSEVIRRAEDGDRNALHELEARPETARTAAEWAAIGKGHSRLGEHGVALDAFTRALLGDQALAEDPMLLHDVRRAADDEGVQKRAFDLASGPLGAGGVDVLFDVWASTLEKTETTVLAKTLLDREEVRKHASKALRVALELRRTTRCEDVKRLVIEAADVADERAFRPLHQLDVRRGCGFLGLADCYPCRRRGEILSDALKAVQQRKGPRF